MYLSKTLAVFAIAFAASIVAVPVAGSTAEDLSLTNEHARITARGSGCPLFRQQCNDHVSDYCIASAETCADKYHSAFLLEEEEPEDIVPGPSERKHDCSSSSSYTLLKRRLLVHARAYLAKHGFFSMNIQLWGRWS